MRDHDLELLIELESVVAAYLRRGVTRDGVAHALDYVRNRPRHIPDNAKQAFDEETPKE